MHTLVGWLVAWLVGWLIVGLVDGLVWSRPAPSDDNKAADQPLHRPPSPPPPPGSPTRAWTGRGSRPSPRLTSPRAAPSSRAWSGTYGAWSGPTRATPRSSSSSRPTLTTSPSRSVGLPSVYLSLSLSVCVSVIPPVCVSVIPPVWVSVADWLVGGWMHGTNPTDPTKTIPSQSHHPH